MFIEMIKKDSDKVSSRSIISLCKPLNSLLWKVKCSKKGHKSSIHKPIIITMDLKCQNMLRKHLILKWYLSSLDILTVAPSLDIFLSVLCYICLETFQNLPEIWSAHFCLETLWKESGKSHSGNHHYFAFKDVKNWSGIVLVLFWKWIAWNYSWFYLETRLWK